MLSQLFVQLERSPFFTQATEALSAKGRGCLLHGLNASAKAALAAHVFRQRQCDIVFVSADDKTAEDYLEDLQLLVGRESACLLPDFEVLPFEERSPHYTIRAQRIEALARAVSGRPQIYSVPLRSLLRQIVPREMFAANIIGLNSGAEYDPDVLVSNLVGMGYANEYQVSRVGEVARRGGIVDVFSPNLAYPVRIEFWGDEIVGMRSFSVASQRSLEGAVKRVTLLPSREFSLHDIDADEQLWERIHDNGFYDGIEQDVSLLLPRLESFAQWLKQPLFLFDEYQFFPGYIEELEQEVAELWQKSRTQKKKRQLPEPTRLFESRAWLDNLLTTAHTHFLASSYQEHAHIVSRLEAPLTSQTNMHSDLGMLERSLNDKIAAGHAVFIQSDNRSQSKRMRELLPELADSVTFTIGVLQKGFNLLDAKLSVFTDHEIFSRYRKRRSASQFAKDEALVDYEALQPGDYIVHIDYGIGVYEGLKRMSVEGSEIECLTLRYADNDTVYVPTFQLSLVSRFVSEEGYRPTIHKLGGKMWETQKQRARKQIEVVAEDIVKLYAERKVRKGIAIAPDAPWQTEMEDAFIYEDTPDQSRSTCEIKQDMESDVPMERLLCGDVGFGKTEVAIRAAFKTVLAGYQVAVLVPTTLLAEQHYLVFRERLAQYPVNITMLSRFRTPAAMKKDIVALGEGQIDIAIGTHRLLSKDVRLKRLGLLIIDEEHRFGVRHKEKLRQIKANVDTLYMSATPIPRTLNMAMSRLKEISLMQTSPKARLPVRTIIVPFDEEIIKDAVNREIDRGGQVFFLHNRVQTIDSMAQDLRKLLPHVRFAIAHGQLPERQLERVMLDFAHHKFDVLITSAIIESGIDIPNANTIIVNRADMFGLAQLYQLRGRVGRSNRRAYAYLVIPTRMSEEARKRLETLTEYDYLGAGYQIAMRDLEIRGAGTLLGTKQSGVINSVGFNYYNQLLEQAITNLDEDQQIWSEQEAQTPPVRVTGDHYFPDSYIADEKTRLDLYKRMLGFENASQFDELEAELIDRFGEAPSPAKQALLFYRLRMHTEHAQLVSYQLKGGELVLEFDSRRLPSRQHLGKLVQRFDYPVRFDTSGNLKVFFTLSNDYRASHNELMRLSLPVLEFIHAWGEA
ncbi:MAG: transcription-repair coupling factor [Candidatus Cloacimonetes bacterium]|nr:transcription-repair coupling factor [Candidatus Cloacimonadota bacterium]